MFLSSSAENKSNRQFTTMTSCRFLVINGVVSQTSVSDVPSVASFLEAHPGAYTTSRTHNQASCILFWERHLRRLADSVRILVESNPDYLFGSGKTRVSSNSLSSSSLSSPLESIIRPIVNDSLRNVLPIALKSRRMEEELAITALVNGNSNNGNYYDEEDRNIIRRDSSVLDVYLHIGVYVPPVFGVRENSAHLAVVGPGRDTANAKFSDWVRLRKRLEKLRPPLANELLLSNDGDRILEGSVTNFFVVCRKEKSYALGECCSYEVQTASISDGVLPGVIRQLVIDVCLTMGIPLCEVAPSWSEHERWEEAFSTSSLRIVQHVETIRVPSSWAQLELKTWKEVSWNEKRFKEGPGFITSIIQREIMKRASLEGYSVSECV